MRELTADLAFQKKFVAKARRDLGLTQSDFQPGYLRDFDRAMRQLAAAKVDERELKAAFEPLDFLLIGDFHTLALSQMEAARLLEFWAGLDAARPVVLALECLTARDQDELEAYQAGRLEEAEFLRRVHWARDWEFDFTHYRPLLAAASRLGLEVLALDNFPRGGFGAVRGRDRQMAQRLAQARRAAPDRRFMVLIGETHLAPRHLPNELFKALSRRPAAPAKTAIVLQNVDQIYWRLDAGERERGFGYFELQPASERAIHWLTSRDARFFMALSASPVQKYESWRGYMAKFSPEEGHAPAERTFHELIDSLLGVLRIPKSLCLKKTGVQVKFLADYYPEVFGPDEFAQFGDRVRGSAMPEARKQIVLSRAPEIGRFYCAPLNLMWIGDAPLRDIAESAGYFINLALKGRVGMVRPLDLPFADRLSERVIEEALSYLGSKIVGPERQFHLLESIGATLRELEAGGGDPDESLEWRAEFRRYRRAQPLLPALRAAEVRFRAVNSGGRGATRAANELEAQLAAVPLFVLAVHEWGYELGERLFDLVQSGKINATFMRAAFTRRFEKPGDGRRELTRLTRKAGM